MHLSISQMGRIHRGIHYALYTVDYGYWPRTYDAEF